MTLSEMEAACKMLREQHGDLDIIGGVLSDDVGPRMLLVLDADGCDCRDDGGKPVGVFITM